MKKFFLTLIVTILFFLTLFIIILSTKGYETNKFNIFITEKVLEKNPEVSLELDKIKFKFDIKDMSLFLETKNPNFYYKKLIIPIEEIKVYLDFFSLVKSKPKIKKISIFSREIEIDELKKIVLKTKPSNLNSFINNRIKSGKIKSNIELYFNNNLDLENFIARGQAEGVSAIVDKNLVFKETSFSFFADKTDALLKEIKSEIRGVSITNGDLRIERNENLNINSNFSSKINFDNKNFIIYSKFFPKNFDYLNNENNFKGDLINNFQISFDKTFKIVNFRIKSSGNFNASNLIFKDQIKLPILKNPIKKLSLDKSNVSLEYNLNAKKTFTANGQYKINDDKFQNFVIDSNFTKDKTNLIIDFDFSQSVFFDLINFTSDTEKMSKISAKLTLLSDMIYLDKLNFSQGKNNILVENLKLKGNKFKSLKVIKVKTYDKNILKNDFSLNYNKKISIKGTKYDATNLSKIISDNNNDNYFGNVNKDIEIDFKEILTPLSKKLSNFKLIGSVKKGKFIKILSKGGFGNDQFLDITLKSDKLNNKKYLEIYSDLPQPLLSDYSFFKGVSGGKLLFSSIIDKKTSNSKLIIEDFKIVNAPAVIKLLSLADFRGLADLADGEGLSFKKLEIQMTKDEEKLNINELYAVGPSVSVLMEGYKDKNGLTSLKGTLVPAKNLNKLLSKIPVIGNIIIPSEVGEGLFGVSFKMKGPPGKIKTTINPIKTLTPRFITKALENIKSPK